MQTDEDLALEMDEVKLDQIVTEIEQSATNGTGTADQDRGKIKLAEDQVDSGTSKQSEDKERLLQDSQNEDDIEIDMNEAEMEEYFKNIEILDEILGLTGEKTGATEDDAKKVEESHENCNVKESQKQFYKNSKEKENNLKKEFRAIAMLCGEAVTHKETILDKLRLNCCKETKNDDEIDTENLGFIDIELLKQLIIRLEKYSLLPVMFNCCRRQKDKDYSNALYIIGNNAKKEAERIKLEEVLDTLPKQLTFECFKKFREEVDEDWKAARERRSVKVGRKKGQGIDINERVKGVRAVAFFKVIGIGKRIIAWPPPMFIPLLTLLQAIVFGIQQNNQTIEDSLQFDTTK